MRAVITADLHLHPFRECSRDGGADRLAVGLSALRQTLQAAKDRGCPWVCAGDLKHLKDRWVLGALNGALALFDEYASVPKVLLHGNHDGLGAGRSGLEPFRSGATVADAPVTIMPGDVAGWQEPFSFWPYRSTTEELRDFLAHARAAKSRVLIGHAFLSGAVLGPSDVRISEGLSLEALGLAGEDRVFDWGFFGDVHKGQCLLRRGLAGKKGVPSHSGVWYVGSPYAQSWGELEVGKGCLYVDTDKGIAEPIPVKAPRFVAADCRGLNNAVLEAFLSGQKLPSGNGGYALGDWAGDYVRLIVGSWADAKLVEHVREKSGAAVFQAVVDRERKTERRAEVHGGMSGEDLLAGYWQARPLDGYPAKTVLEAGRRLLRNG